MITGINYFDLCLKYGNIRRGWMHQLWASRTDGEYFQLCPLILDGSLHNRQNSGSI